MRPSALYEVLKNDSVLANLGVTQDRIFEAQSVDQRPHDSGYFITLNMREMNPSIHTAIRKGPRTLEINVHHPMDISRDYTTIDRILNRIQAVYSPLIQYRGTDGIRITEIRPMGRSGNDIDEGWRTITRQATYGVLYDEYAG